MQNGPILWDALLSAVRETFGSGIVAGGCVRDYLLGEQPKDIDIFVNVSDRDEMARLGALLPADFTLALMTGETITEYETAPDWQSEVFGVLDGVYADGPRDDFLLDGINVQIIARPLPEFSGPALVSRFDLGITQCWYDGSIHETDEAFQDRSARTLTLMRWDTEAHVKSTMRRVARLTERLGLTFIDPRSEKAAAK